MKPANNLSAANEFWTFSLNFYDRPNVAAALLALQDEAARNVNLALFAIWHGLSARGRLDQDRIAALERAVRPIECEVITPLRTLRRRLKTMGDHDLQGVRDRIKAIEIEAEQVAQTRLAALAAAPSETDPSDRLVDAEANFALYLGAATAAGRAAALIRRELRRFHQEQPPVPPRRRSRPSA